MNFSTAKSEVVQQRAHYAKDPRRLKELLEAMTLWGDQSR